MLNKPCVKMNRKKKGNINDPRIKKKQQQTQKKKEEEYVRRFSLLTFARDLNP